MAAATESEKRSVAASRQSENEYSEGRPAERRDAPTAFNSLPGAHFGSAAVDGIARYFVIPDINALSRRRRGAATIQGRIINGHGEQRGCYPPNNMAVITAETEESPRGGGSWGVVQGGLALLPIRDE